MIDSVRDDVSTWVRTALGGRPMPAVAVVIGVGDGAVLDAVTAMRADVRVLVLEPDPAIAQRFQRQRDVAGIAPAGRVRLLIGPDYAGADDAWRVLADDPEDHIVLVSPSAAAARERALAAARLFGRMLFGARANVEARRTFAPGYLQNSLANLGAIVHGSRADAFDGCWTGRPAVVVGAGPSLDRTLPALADLASRAVVITTDTALRPLLHAGVSPEVVVGADPSPSNGRHFENLPPCENTWLVAESALDPHAAAVFAGRTAWFRVAAHDPWPWAMAAGVDVPVIDMWGSVLTAAWQLALRAGCDPIVFVGADLAFTSGRPYARGTTYEFDWAYSATLGTRLDEAWRQQIAMSGGVTLPGVDGTPVASSPPLQAFRDWLASQAARSGRRVVNATGGGILAGPSIVQATLGDELRARPVLSRAMPPIRPTADTSSTAIAAAVAVVRRALAATDTVDATLATWARFTGAALDRPSIEDALRVATEAIDAPAGGVTRRAPEHVPWPALAAAGFRMDRLSRLPEDVLDAPRAPEPLPDVVAQAFVAGSAAAAALTMAQPAPPTAGTPASPADPRQLVWPAAVAWPLRVLDAVRPAVVARPASSYFDTAMPAPAATGDGVASPSAVLHGRIVARLVRDLATQNGTGVGDRLHGIAAAIERVSTTTAAVGRLRPATLTLAVEGPGAYAAQVAIEVSRPAAARALTGAILARDTTDRAVTLTSWRHGAIGVRLTCASTLAIVPPDVLTDRGLPRAAAVYGHDGAAILVPLHGTTSLRMDATGMATLHLTWPASIVGELPMGDGAVAWSNGTAQWPDVGEGYVMYRERVGGPVLREPLPFRPTIGAWLDGRLYWTLFRSGLGVWAPREWATARHDAHSFAGVTVTDDSVHLAPLTRDDAGRAVRQVHARGWRLERSGDLTPMALGPDGGCVAQAAGAGWTARAFPDTDSVQLTGGGRVVDLVCYFPIALAWAGPTLFVSTASGDVLRFDRLAETLDRLV